MTQKRSFHEAPEEEVLKAFEIAWRTSDAPDGTEGHQWIVEEAKRLQDQVDEGKLVAVGGLCLVSSDLEAVEVDAVRNFASHKDYIAALVDVGNVLSECEVHHSYIKASTLSLSASVSEGSIIIDSKVGDSSRLWATRLRSAEAILAVGSSGGQELSGRLDRVNIAATASQVFVRPRAF